ncbi:SDR family NAD(P)-dependent oxidoreductase [Caulobacter sp. KR2-114]|uniref:SDR family NAD(P)-dependent oxidoreductase n=1 Tax=Caulobacter sp. KR2-114 TaxID=3400912 RepID=UPI003C0147FF
MTKTRSKTLFITGAASGIGAAAAKLAVERGHRVVVADINFAGAQAVAAAIGEGALPMALDITSEAQWDRALDETWSRFGGLDVLVNNAAIVCAGRAENVAIADHQRTMDVNFMGPVKGMLNALPRFKRQKSGHFVTVCSMTAFLPFPGIASYAAAKHALRAFHHALAIEERDSKLAFTIIHPTSTETPMLEEEARSDEVNLAFASPSVTAEFVGGVVLDAMDKKALEVFMPPERGRTVRLLGTNPRALRKMVERGEAVGFANLQARRAAGA